MGPNGLLHQILCVFSRITGSWICSDKVFNMSDFDNYIMDYYEEIWENQKEEDHEPEE